MRRKSVSFNDFSGLFEASAANSATVTAEAAGSAAEAAEINDNAAAERYQEEELLKHHQSFEGNDVQDYRFF